MNPSKPKKLIKPFQKKSLLHLKTKTATPKKISCLSKTQTQISKNKYKKILQLLVIHKSIIIKEYPTKINKKPN
jgi:hypothetical protein